MHTLNFNHESIEDLDYSIKMEEFIYDTFFNTPIKSFMSWLILGILIVVICFILIEIISFIFSNNDLSNLEEVRDNITGVFAVICVIIFLVIIYSE